MLHRKFFKIQSPRSSTAYRDAKTFPTTLSFTVVTSESMTKTSTACKNTTPASTERNVPFLRALTHQNSVWKWTKKEEDAFRKLQNELTSNRVMAYFDTAKPMDVLVDASPTALGVILIQDGKVISYGSRALSDVETRYSQTEREMLAVVWAAEHYRLNLLVMVQSSKYSQITNPFLEFSRATNLPPQESTCGNLD